MLFGSFPILVLLRLLRQLCRVRYYVRDKLTEALGVLRGDNGLARFGFQRFSRHTRDIAAAAGDLLIFVKALRLLRFRNIGRGRFCQHGQHQLQIAHIIAEIFLFQPLEILILPRVHARPRAGDLVRQNGVFSAFLHAALFPLVRQLVSDADGKQPLMYPFLRIALFQIGFQRAVDRLLRVDGLLDAFPADHRQPRLERLGFLRVIMEKLFDPGKFSAFLSA